MELYFIRHGQSVSNANWNNSDFVDPPDPELTEAGHAQAACLADFLSRRQPLQENGLWNIQNRAGFGLTHLYTSPMRRALDTAVPVARALGLPLTLWPEIHEAGGAFIRQADGSLLCLPGSPRSFFESNYPEIHLPGRIDERGWWQGRPLETAEERRARAARFLDELLALHGDRDDRPEQRVAVFSHGEFFVHFMSVAFQMNARQGANGFHAWLFMNNTALARIDVRKSEFLLCYTNRVDHLPAELIT